MHASLLWSEVGELVNAASHLQDGSEMGGGQSIGDGDRGPLSGEGHGSCATLGGEGLAAI